jgi:integrase
MSGIIKKSDNGTYWFIVDLGRKPNGKRYQAKRRGFKTKQGADKAMTALKAEYDSGTFIDPSKRTIADYLEDWLETSEQLVAPKTFERYQQMVRNHLLPELGGALLQKVGPLEIQQAYARLLTSGRADGKGGLAPKTVRNIHGVLSSALQAAKDWKLISEIPTKSVKLPRVEKKEMKILDKPQSAILLRSLEDLWLYPIVLVALTTGMRRGEILALKWSKINLQEGFLEVVQSVEQTAAGKRLKDVKTEQGKRNISLAPMTVQALETHKTQQAERLLRLGIRQDDDGLVFTNFDGSMRDPLLVSTSFREHMAKLDIPRIRFHDLRHTHISHLLADGNDIKTVSSRAGHANPSITLNIYAHSMRDSQRELAANYGEALEAEMERQGNRDR